jgi:hypothetical protein
MGYVLLWVEHLAVALLLVATLVACIGRLQQPWRRVVLSLLVALPPLAVYAITVLGLGYLRFRETILVGLFYPLALLTACYAIGVVWILLVGLRRRCDDPPTTVAAAWPRGKLALVMCVAVGLHMMTWWNLDLAVKQRLASLQVQSAAHALSIAPARLPDRDNAALIYDQTYEALDQSSWSEIHRDKWDDWTKLDKQGFDPNDPDLKSFLNEQTPTLTLLRQAGQKPGCHFGREYARVNIATLMPELGDLRMAAHLLALDARYRAAQEDMQTALADVDTMFAIAEHVGSDPILVSTLVAISIDAIATETLQEVLAADAKRAGDARITTEQLQAIDLDGSLSFQRLYRRSLRLEMVSALNFFQQLSSGDPEWWRFVNKEDPLHSYLPSPLPSFYRMFMATTDVASYRNAMDEMLQIATQPYHEAKKEWAEFDKRFKSKPKGFITALLLPALSGVAEAGGRGDARHRTARLALAAARYRADNSDLPKNLDALVPDYIPILPRDPFDGKPMKYRATNDGAVIYSIGPDDKDDDGAPWDKDAKVGDITFELKR